MNKNKEKIKALLVAATLITVFLIAASPSVLGETTDAFTVTVRGEYIDIQINQTTWQINSGNAVTLSTSYWTNGTYNDYFQATLYNCSVTVDLKLHVSTDGTTWNIGAAAGAVTYALNSSLNQWSTGDTNVTLTTSEQVISSSITKDTNETFDLRFDAPTSTTTGNTQTITCTATVIKS